MTTDNDTAPPPNAYEPWYETFSRQVRAMAPPDFPRIVCLCGSTRFKAAWYEQTKRLTHAGYIVLGVGDLEPNAEGTNVPIDPALKARLDVLHKQKIDLSDEVLILNVGGYVGDSTRGEIAHAKKRGKVIRYLEPLTEPTHER